MGTRLIKVVMVLECESLRVDVAVDDGRVPSKVTVLLGCEGVLMDSTVCDTASTFSWVATPCADPFAFPFVEPATKSSLILALVFCFLNCLTKISSIASKSGSLLSTPRGFLTYLHLSHPKSHKNFANAKGKLIIQTSTLKKLTTMMTMRQTPSNAPPTHAPRGSRRTDLTLRSPETFNLGGRYSARRN